MKKTNSQTAENLLAAVFTGAILLVLLLGAVQTVFFPGEIAENENRYANRLKPVSLSNYLDGSFQDNVEAALGDQVTLSATFKSFYQDMKFDSVSLLNGAFREALQTGGQYVVHLGDFLIFNWKNLVYNPYPQSRTAELDVKIQDYNETLPQYPDTEFYLYYIEKDTDINFQTGEKADFYGYLRDALQLDGEHMACFSIDSFDEFQSFFYETDHHWNHLGSYRGYLEVLELLKVEDEPVQPKEAVQISGSFSGSKATGYTSGFSESFYAYRFDWPEMRITINGAPAQDYGAQELYLSGQSDNVTYGAFYGGDEAEIIFSTDRPERRSILVIGESYDNAILKLLTCHFNCTYSIDLRYYETFVGHPFSLSQYLEEHEIDTVLLIGNVDYFLMPEFELGE